MLALPGGQPGKPLPPAEPGLPVHLAAGCMLAAAGLAARAGQFRYSSLPGDLVTEVMVISPAALARGDAWGSGEGSVRWECRFADPDHLGGGLTPAQAADAVVAALPDYRNPGRAGERGIDELA